jgi:sugar phosphate isomerase/epimerase
MTEINALDTAQVQRDVADFMRCIEVAGELECPCIRVYGGSYMPDRDAAVRERKEQQLIESLQLLGPQAAQVGVTLVVETHFNTLTCTAAETADLVRRVNHPHVRVLYDQPNLGFVGAEDYQEALPLLKGLIKMVHVKDFAFKDPTNRAFKASYVTNVKVSERIIRSKIPGEGIVPWPEILPTLHAQGFDGYLSLEYERRWHPEDLPLADEGMKQGLEYIRNILAEHIPPPSMGEIRGG